MTQIFYLKTLVYSQKNIKNESSFENSDVAHLFRQVLMSRQQLEMAARETELGGNQAVGSHLVS